MISTLRKAVDYAVDHAARQAKHDEYDGRLDTKDRKIDEIRSLLIKSLNRIERLRNHRHEFDGSGKCVYPDCQVEKQYLPQKSRELVHA